MDASAHDEPLIFEAAVTLERSAQLGRSRSPLKKKRLMFAACMSRNWDTVTREFQNDPTVREAKITSSEDTIVHFAVIEGRRTVVQALIDALVSEKEKKNILLLKNKNGSTPLHLAAAQGDCEMCEFLASVSPKDLIGAQNNEGETPLFVAALHGKMEPFFVLYNKLKEVEELTQIVRYIRRHTDGNTVLHVAILGEHFDLAFQIIKIYQEVERYEDYDLANVHNEKGQTALHILARSPHSFRSGYYFGIIDTIIYFLSWADRLESKIDSSCPRKPSELEDKTLLPENYITCMNLVQLLFWKPFEDLRGRCQERNEGDPENPAAHQSRVKDEAKRKEKEKRTTAHVALKYLPSNYEPLFRFIRLAMMISMVFLGLGFWRLKRMKFRKQRHTWAVQIMEELVKGASAWEYNADGKRPLDSTSFEYSDVPAPQQFSGKRPPDLESSSIEYSDVPTPKQYVSGTDAPDTDDDEHRNTEGNKKKIADQQKTDDTEKTETPILVAAKTGVVEMVELILNTFPVAIRDVNKEGKNVVLLAVEHRQPFVYQLLMHNKYRNDNVFQRVDNEGNSALHLAAVLGNNRPWVIPGAALQMQWEIKWFRFVKDSVPPYFFMRVNHKGRTAREIFNETHRKLVGEGGKWLNTTSQSCSVVAALIAAVAFAAAVTVPGGVKENIGIPNLEGQQVFDMFAISSLVALGLSVTSLITFLSILTSRHVAKDFEWSLPMKLMVGLTSLFFSITAILISFCSGHYFILRNHLRTLAFYMYAVACFPVLLFAFAQFPLYFDLGVAIVTRVPHRTYKETAH